MIPSCSYATGQARLSDGKLSCLFDDQELVYTFSSTKALSVPLYYLVKNSSEPLAAFYAYS
jgi:hypothetical protein